MTFTPIAIVGQSCVLPGALDPQALWDAVLQKQNLLTPADADKLSPAHIFNPAVADTPTDQAWHNIGGYVRGFAGIFDARGFQLPAELIQQLAPVFQWVLHTGREALRASEYKGDLTKAGAILANLSYPTKAMDDWCAAELVAHETVLPEWLRTALPPRPHPLNRFMSGAPAQLLAQALGFGGRAFCLDAACAGSLYAIKLACDALQRGEADLMLAGGVNAINEPLLHIGFTGLQALSKSGRSRPFHREADGLVPALGAAVLALRRLDDALAEGAPILGIIRGIGLSNDGSSGGFLSPSSAAQVRAMRQAYQVAGLSPHDISLIECHATGTTVGDAVEVESLRQVFADCTRVPIGSLKSNLGHLTSAAGAAGVLKVLAAFQAKTLPPTIGADEPLSQLSDAPVRLLHEAEAWESTEPRRAAVSAFGFGGNNAHLILEEPMVRPRPRGQSLPCEQAASNQALPAGTQAHPIAIVGIGVCAAGAKDRNEFAQAWLRGESQLRARDGGLAGVIEAFELDCLATGFPPRDLEQTQPQQLLLLRAAHEALQTVQTPARENVSVFVGMGTDTEVSRYNVRLHLPALVAAWQTNAAQALPADWLAAVKDSISPPLNATRTLGCMPNIPANRLNVQANFQGPSLTFSAEELSGLVALETGCAALHAGEADAVVVGAVDLSAELSHEAAARACLPADRHIAGDAAVVLVLKRLADAQAAGDTVFAVINNDAPATSDLQLGFGAGRQSLTAQFGHAHAASGLLHVAAGALALHHRCLPGTTAPLPWLPRAQRLTADVAVDSFAGQRAVVHLAAAPDDSAVPMLLAPAPHLYFYSGVNRAEVIRRLQANETSAEGGTARLAIVASTDEEFARKREQALQLLSNHPSSSSQIALLKGIYYADQPLGGEVAFTFPSSAGAYSGMGQELLCAFPEILARLQSRLHDPASLHEAAQWIYDAQLEDGAIHVFDKLKGALFLAQVHAILSREILGLQPDACLGFSAGETAALFAAGAWSEIDRYYREIAESHTWTRELAGELRVLEQAWQAYPDIKRAWRNWAVFAPVEEVRAALAAESLAHLVTINAPGTCTIAGQAEACERVVQRLGTNRCQPLHYDLIHHCPEIQAYRAQWQRLNTRPTKAVNIRFYSGANPQQPFYPDEAKAADTLVGMAEHTVDYPALIEQAWNDGVRVFIEHGARSSCTSYIQQILAGRPHLAVSLDSAGTSCLRQIGETVAQLYVAGVPFQHHAFNERFAQKANQAMTPTRKLVRSFPAHWPPIQWPKLTTENTMEPAPPLPSVLTLYREQEQRSRAASASVVGVTGTKFVPEGQRRLAGGGTTGTVANGHASPTTDAASSHASSGLGIISPTVPAVPPPANLPRASGTQTAMPTDAPAPAQQSSLLTGIGAFTERLAQVHQQFLQQQTETHAQFLRMREQALQSLLAVQGLASQPQPIVPTPEINFVVQEIADNPAPALAPPVIIAPPAPMPSATRRQPIGPTFNRAQLQIHASRNISEIFGPQFAQQDQYAVQVRMPEPPLLLADRVTGMDAVAGSLKLGTVWTETDVYADSWFVHQGHILPGLMIETGQADLFLISYLGIDWKNRGERAYRLLGCEATYLAPLPQPGDTLSFEISIDAHAVEGQKHLFFFHYNCYVNDTPVLRVRSGQAGFFTKEELAESKGVLWSANDVTLDAPRWLDAPRVIGTKQQFNRAELEAFANGDLVQCFGAGYERAQTHTRTPAIARGDLLLLDEVTAFDPQGGPWQRGYLRAVRRVNPDDWFFAGHFKNDPCMPGTLMTEMAFQGMSVYLAALGYTLDKDGWTFAPVPGEMCKLSCRGQVTPESNELTMEIFVREVKAGPVPTLIVDVLGSVDGLKALHAERLSLHVTPDFPNLPRAQRPAISSPKAVAMIEGIACDEQQALDCAWGRPSEAFGKAFAKFDQGPRVARLPGAPYLFVSRVIEIDAKYLGMEKGGRIVTEWDIPRDSIFFAANGNDTLPFCVIQEAVLQPCGWLSVYMGVPLSTERELCFRNLDGTLELYEECTRQGGTLRTVVENTSLSSLNGTTILAFQVEAFLDDRPLLKMKTVFGYFDVDAMAQQAGLPTTEDERKQLSEPSALTFDLTQRPAQFFGQPLRLADDELRLLDRISGYWPQGGAAGLGRVRGEKYVQASDWFFKAHFFQDPVQPGSLGLEVMLQLLKFAMLQEGLAAGIDAPRFEPLALHTPISWRYRGQVTPDNQLIQVVLDVTECGRDERGVIAKATATLWCDGLKIYDATNIGLRIVSGTA
ncbi:MAG TPA: beta-ketoacyl synthase N-terminal-like domain-containing protein [Blastocatellia bacterium]|nr:beta-ketoacyl synthase N-terminal-like domain-containing protein [Blastocatellia bacterium]